MGLKWGHLRRGLASGAEEEPWSILDVRFDEAVSLTRAEVEAFFRGEGRR